jgi:hypothetical protein
MMCSSLAQVNSCPPRANGLDIGTPVPKTNRKTPISQSIVIRDSNPASSTTAAAPLASPRGVNEPVTVELPARFRGHEIHEAICTVDDVAFRV